MYRYRVREAISRDFGADRPELLLRAGLSGALGESWEDERGAIVATGFFTYLLGEPTPGPELDTILPAACPYGVVPKSAAWRDYLTGRYPCAALTRYHLSPPNGAAPDFAPPAGVEIRPIDRDLCRRGLISAGDLNLGHGFSDFEDFFAKGFGFAALLDGEIAGLVRSYLVFGGEAEADICTAPAFRRQGVAAALGAAFLRECAARGLTPSWDAQNPASAALAEKLGFSGRRSYTLYALQGGPAL